MKAFKLLKEDDGTIIWSDNCIFIVNLKMEPLSDIFYSIDDNQIMDELWIDDTINSSDSETAKELDKDDAFFDADLSYDEEISDEESSNLISYLLTDKWWMTPEYNEYDLFHAFSAVTDGIPTNFAEAMKSEDRDYWKAAMDCEMKNIRDNDTYQIKKIKNGEKAIGCRWVFKKKLNKDGSVNKFKARLVAKGYLQRFGTDYNETFAPVAKFKSIRLLLAISAHQSWKVYHDDVTSAFLNGILKEKVIMDQPDGYQQGSSLHKWELQKTLYGLKQSPREWNEVIHNFLIDEGFIQSKLDPCLYHKKTDSYEIIAGIYVDDVISTGSDDAEVQKFRTSLKGKFKCSEGGLLDWSLGMEVQQGIDGIKISQTQYILQKLDQFKEFLKPNVQRTTSLDPNFQHQLIKANDSVETEENFPYRSMVESLMYAATGTRPDITTAVGIVSRYLSSPKSIHCDMVRQIFTTCVNILIAVYITPSLKAQS